VAAVLLLDEPGAANQVAPLDNLSGLGIVDADTDNVSENLTITVDHADKS